MSKSINHNYTEGLAEYLVGLDQQSLSEQLRSKLKIHILDTLGAILQGSTTPWNRRVRELVLSWGGTHEAWICGTSEATASPNAVMVNAMASHSFELDDTHVPSHVHPGSGTVSAALAMAQASPNDGITDDDLLVAVLAGYEAALRIGLAVGHGAFERGFYPPGIGIAFGAATTAGKMYGFDRDLMAQCLAITATQASGLYSPTSVKRFNIGNGARAGIVAAQLVRSGLRGVDNALEAPVGGFCDTISDHVRWEYLEPPADGEDFLIWDVGLKRYSCSRPNHTSIDAMAEIRTERGKLDPDEIERIDIECSTSSYRYGHGFEINDVPQAFMSIAYCAGAMLVYGDVFVDQFTRDAIQNPLMVNVLDKFHIRPSDTVDQLGPDMRDTVYVTVKLVNGETYERRMDNGTGQPEKPLANDELHRKFTRLAEHAFDNQRASAIASAVDRLGGASMHELIDLLHA